MKLEEWKNIPDPCATLRYRKIQKAACCWSLVGCFYKLTKVVDTKSDVGSGVCEIEKTTYKTTVG